MEKKVEVKKEMKCGVCGYVGLNWECEDCRSESGERVVGMICGRCMENKENVGRWGCYFVERERFDKYMNG